MSSFLLVVVVIPMDDLNYPFAKKIYSDLSESPNNFIIVTYENNSLCH